MSATKVTEAGNFNNMQKLGFSETLNKLKEKRAQIKQITTYQHRQIRNISVNNKKQLRNNLTFFLTFLPEYAQ